MKIYNLWLDARKSLYHPWKSISTQSYGLQLFSYRYARPFVFDTCVGFLNISDVTLPAELYRRWWQNINKAKEENLPALEVSEKYIKEYFKDAEAQCNKGRRKNLRFYISRIILSLSALWLKKAIRYEADGDVYYITLSSRRPEAIRTEYWRPRVGC